MEQKQQKQTSIRLKNNFKGEQLICLPFLLYKGVGNMLFTELKVKNKKYKLRLNTRATILLEKKMKKNPLEVMYGITQGMMPTLEEVMDILYHSLIPYHETSFETIDSVYDFYDKYIENGGSLEEILEVLLEVINACGYFKKVDDKEVNNEKK